MIWLRVYISIILLAVFSLPTEVHAGTTLDAVQKRGVLKCGVGELHQGFTYIDTNGRHSGFDVDFCRAIAAAVFGDSERVQFVPLNNMIRLTALKEGEVDVLIRTTTWTLSRDTTMGLNFAGVTLYDGQGVMVPASMNVKSLSEIKKARLCVARGTTSILNIVDYLKVNDVDIELKSYASQDATVKAFFTGLFDVYSDDKSALVGIRATSAPKVADYIILSDTLSKEPLGPAVRVDDNDWFNIVRWVVFATIEAEEMGLTSENVNTMKSSDVPTIRRFLGSEGEFGTGLKLSNDWAYNIISKVGNYGEIFERNVGKDTVIGLPRGQNALWKNGGLIYAMPFR